MAIHHTDDLLRIKMVSGHIPSVSSMELFSWLTAPSFRHQLEDIGDRIEFGNQYAFGKGQAGEFFRAANNAIRPSLLSSVHRTKASVLRSGEMYGRPRIKAMRALRMVRVLTAGRCFRTLERETTPM